MKGKRTKGTKRILGLILSLAMGAALIPAAYAELTAAKDDEIKITYNGEIIETDTPPVIVDDRTLVPARAVFEKMGCEVEWKDGSYTVPVVKDGGVVELEVNSQTVTVTKEISVKSDMWTMAWAIISIRIGSNELHKTVRGISSIPEQSSDLMGGDTITLDVPAQIINDRTMIPVRAVAEAMDITVDWDGDTRTVILADTEVAKETVPFELSVEHNSSTTIVSVLPIMVSVKNGSADDTYTYEWTSPPY